MVEIRTDGFTYIMQVYSVSFNKLDNVLALGNRNTECYSHKSIYTCIIQENGLANIFSTMGKTVSQCSRVNLVTAKNEQGYADQHNGE